MAEKAQQLEIHEEIEIAKQHDQYIEQISALNDAQQRTALIQKIHEISRELFIERKQNHQLEQLVKQKDQLLNKVVAKLTEQATSLNQLAADVQQNISSPASSLTSNNVLSTSFNHLPQKTLATQFNQIKQPSLIDLSASSPSFAEFESMLRSTQEEIDRQFIPKPSTNPHRPTDGSSQSSLDNQSDKRSARGDVGSLYDQDGELTRRGRAMAGSIFSMFANNGQSMSFDDLTRLHQATIHKSVDTHSSDNKDDDDDDLLWCLWQSHASSNENDGVASLSEEDLASIYVQEEQFDLDQHARTLGLIVL